MFGMPRPPMGPPMPGQMGPAPLRPLPPAGPLKKPGLRPPAAMIRQAILAKLQGAMK